MDEKPEVRDRRSEVSLKTDGGRHPVRDAVRIQPVFSLAACGRSRLQDIRSSFRSHAHEAAIGDKKALTVSLRREGGSGGHRNAALVCIA
jgi:hypothetical protein